MWIQQESCRLAACFMADKTLWGAEGMPQAGKTMQRFASFVLEPRVEISCLRQSWL